MARAGKQAAHRCPKFRGARRPKCGVALTDLRVLGLIGVGQDCGRGVPDPSFLKQGIIFGSTAMRTGNLLD